MIRRALLALGGLVRAPSGSSAAAWPGPRGLPYNARSGLCAPRREDLLTAIEIALVLRSTGIAVAVGC